jgi:hypothetical protein
VATQPQSPQEFTDAPPPPEPGGGHPEAPPKPGGGPPEKGFFRVWTGLPGLLKALAGLVTAVGTLIGVLVATHGDTGSPPHQNDQTLSTWVADANRVCRTMYAANAALTPPQTLADYAVYVPQQVDILEGTIRQFRQLTPPPDQAAQVERLVGTLNDSISDLQNYLQTLQSGDIALAENIFAKANSDNARFTAIATDLGVHDCAR